MAGRSHGWAPRGLKANGITPPRAVASHRRLPRPLSLLWGPLKGGPWERDDREGPFTQLTEMDRLLAKVAQFSQGRKDLFACSRPICEVHSASPPAPPGE